MMGADTYMINRTPLFLGLLFSMDGPEVILSSFCCNLSLVLILSRFNLGENDRITMLSGIAQ